MHPPFLPHNSTATTSTFLRFKDGRNETQTISIQTPFMLGHDFLKLYRLPEDNVSPRHALIEEKPYGFVLRDLKSLSGTYINNARAFEVQLQDHDRIRLGNIEFTFISQTGSQLRQFYLQSRNKFWRDELERVPSLAKSHLPVLITGPSGTGKELLAQLIHQYSARSRGPFLSVNCSTLVENLTESELFGHAKGSFTGAQESRPGAFEFARGGTLFLDEISELPLSLQPKLLRALENSEIKPVGSDEVRKIDVRIVAATNQDLRLMMASGKFRKDLYYRLQVLEIHVPPLTERMEDFESILKYYSDPLKIRYTAEAIKFLRAHTWPGNIRELKNTVSRAGTLFPQRAIGIREIHTLIDPSDANVAVRVPRDCSPRRKFIEIEKRAIIEKLLQYDGNQRQAAIALGMPRSTLNDRIRRYNIKIDAVPDAEPTFLPFMRNSPKD